MQTALFGQSTQEENGDDPIDRADSPEGFKKTKAGIIPEGWSICKLRDIIEEINAGYSARSRDRTILDGEVGVLKVSAATHGTFQAQEHKAVEPDAVEDVKISPRAGDLVMSRSSGTESLVGACVYVEEDHPNLYLPDTLWQIKVKGGVSARWLNYALASERMRARIRGEAYGTSGMKKLSMRRLRGLRISLPPPEEQRRIADILRTWDRAIEQTDTLIDRKQTRLHGLRQRLMTGKKRFPEFNEPWRSVKLGNVTRELRDRNEGRLGSNRVYGVKNTEGLTSNTDRSPSDDLAKYKIVPQDAFAYNPMRLDVGSIGRLREEGPVLVSRDYIVFECKPDKLDPAFLDHFKDTHRWDHYVESTGSGSVRVRVYYDHLEGMTIPLPSHPEQQRIVDTLDAAEAEIDQLKQKRDALKRQKNGLMQRLLTGEIRTV
jgi:type I restriction enzyme S subunit